MVIKQYKCPNCGGAVMFDSSSQALKCLSCKTAFEFAAFDEPVEAPEPEYFDFEPAAFKEGREEAVSGVTEYYDFEIAETRNWDEADQNDLRAGDCPSCGAEFFGNENTVAAVCPCCGNAQILVKRLSGGLKPDYIIPFKLEKKDAVAALKDYCKGHRFLPGGFTRNNRVEEMQGMYAPFWLFDAKAEGTARFRAVTGHGKETKRFTLRCNGVAAFDRVPVDASEKLDDAYMDAIEPFNYNEMVEFNNSFLAGYAAEKYDLGVEICKARAELRAENSLRMELKARAGRGVDSVEEDDYDIDVKTGKASYGLFPVWVLNTKFQKINYKFMMNGQTGRIVGELPVDISKTSKYGFALAGISSAVLTILALTVLAPIINLTDAYIGGADGLGTSFLLALPVTVWIIACIIAVKACFSTDWSVDTIRGAGVLIIIPGVIFPSFLLYYAIIISCLVSMAAGVEKITKWKEDMNNAQKKTMAFGYTAPGSVKCWVTETW